MSQDFYNQEEKIYDAEVLESSTFEDNIIIKILLIILILIQTS